MCKYLLWCDLPTLYCTCCRARNDEFFSVATTFLSRLSCKSEATAFCITSCSTQSVVALFPSLVFCISYLPSVVKTTLIYKVYTHSFAILKPTLVVLLHVHAILPSLHFHSAILVSSNRQCICTKLRFRSNLNHSNRSIETPRLLGRSSRSSYSSHRHRRCRCRCRCPVHHMLPTLFLF